MSQRKGPKGKPTGLNVLFKPSWAQGLEAGQEVPKIKRPWAEKDYWKSENRQQLGTKSGGRI